MNLPHNPLVHADRKLGGAASAWARQFDCAHLKPLIICRGPIRKEAMDVFAEMGIEGCGILLSEKDSIVYRNSLAPELRGLRDPERIHRVPDYSGSGKDEREARIRQIIGIAREHGYNAVFAGYGFMAEDEALVSALEDAGLMFIGPCSRTVHGAGLKDEAKRTALAAGVSVTPGIDNGTALALLKKYPDAAALKTLAAERELELAADALDDKRRSLEDKADLVLAAAYRKGIDLYTVEELGDALAEAVAKIAAENPGSRVRLKAIGGGGGKGQRILSLDALAGKKAKQAANAIPENLRKEVHDKVREILSEVKATGAGDNKNVLAELNIETTRHQEIQVIGNGEWTLALGGRDCSLQMHEQKLLEVSVTQESLSAAAAEAKAAGRGEEAKALAEDLATLKAMEAEAERFGAAVGLDSVSTFECIVDGSRHFFMEMNTRIQVEHRVTELCYGLKFANPKRPEESFQVDSLVEAMALLAAHGGKLPKPERVARCGSAVEARLNATNAALQPHAGGVIEHWSAPIAGEIRDDQGISRRNPDTGVFMKYTLAGAYDSNIALLLTAGDDRPAAYRQLAEALRRTVMRGRDLATNLEFHYGLVNWFIGANVNARPTTRFILPYLSAAGKLKAAADDLDLDYGYRQLLQRAVAGLAEEQSAAWRAAFERKQSLLRRPLAMLLREPHLLAGWLGLHRDCFADSLLWQQNPVELLAGIYRYLNMDYQPGRPAAEMIWDHDHELLREALDFYRTINQRLAGLDWPALCRTLSREQPPDGFSAGEWAAARAAHAGFQCGMDLLLALPHLARRTGFFELAVKPDLTIHIPEDLLDPALQTRMARVLAPPPQAAADQILAASGGMFYAREAPDAPRFVEAGGHFNAGDPLYIVEVMKMFNKVHAPFSGTIEEILVEEDGVIISKGQPLFRITPDERVAEESPADIERRRRAATDAFLSAIAA